MDSVTPTNQKNPAIPGDDWDAIADRLVELAKAHPELRRILVRTLVNPAFSVEEPKIQTKRLLTALKVADVAGSIIYGEAGDLSALDRWQEIRELLVGRLRAQLVFSRPLSTHEARELRFCLEQLRPWWEPYSQPDLWRIIEHDLTILEATGRIRNSFFPKGRRRPGRRRKLKLHQERIIAAVELGRQCGVRDAAQEVVEILHCFGIHREAKTVANLWSSYRNYPGRLPDRDAMAQYHIEGILWLVRPAVKEWEKRAGVHVIPRKRHRIGKTFRTSSP